MGNKSASFHVMKCVSFNHFVTSSQAYEIVILYFVVTDVETFL